MELPVIPDKEGNLQAPLQNLSETNDHDEMSKSSEINIQVQENIMENGTKVPVPINNLPNALDVNLKNLNIKESLNKEKSLSKQNQNSSDESDCENTNIGVNYEDYAENFDRIMDNVQDVSEQNYQNSKAKVGGIISETGIEQNVLKLNDAFDFSKDKQKISSTLSAKAPEFKPHRVNPFNTPLNQDQGASERMPSLLSTYSVPDGGESYCNSNVKGSASSELYHPTFELMPSKKQNINETLADLQKSLKNVKEKTQSPLKPQLPSSYSSGPCPWVKMAESADSNGAEPQAENSQSNNFQYDKLSSPGSKHSPSTEVEHHLNTKKNNVDNDDTNRDAYDEGSSASCSSEVVYVPGPCEPDDLIEGIIFTANYLGSTQLMSEKNPAKSSRMFQAQQAVSRIKAPDGEHQPSVEVDLFISTAKVKVLNADTQETMMEHFLRSISYIADIGELLVIMAKRRPPRGEQEEDDMIRVPNKQEKRNRIICHVFSSADAHLMAQAIGQAFNVAYQQFLRANGIEPQALTQDDFNTILDTQEMYHDDLVHYSKQENVKELWIEKTKGEGLGIVVVESGWGSILPTVVLANMQHGSAVERSGKMSIGDQIMSINSTSLVGLPLQTCHSIIKGLKNNTLVKINIVSCPPVVTVLIKRPDLKYQLGFSVQNGIICSLMRGGIAERGGVRVGHRIIEINSQSVVAIPHDKIVQMLVTSVGEIQMKTMPAAMYRLLTGQEQPVYI